MDQALALIPSALLPAGISVPAAVDDVLPALSGMRVAERPADDHHLLRRVDTKFALPRIQLPVLLKLLGATHSVLPAAGRLAASYATIYFDTQELRFLTDHLRGRRPRHKLRVRHYLDRQLSVLEVKTKTVGDRTEKLQRRRDFGGNGLTADEQQWADAHAGHPGHLRARAWTTCQRLTLLSDASAARLTVDLNVALGTADGARSLADTALVEVKQQRAYGDPRLLRLLHGAGARPVRLSKYVAAMTTARPALPKARFSAVLEGLARPDRWSEVHA